MGSKKVVLKLRSVNSIVRPAASTGREKAKRNEVIRTDHTKRGRWDHGAPVDFML